MIGFILMRLLALPSPAPERVEEFLGAFASFDIYPTHCRF